MYKYVQILAHYCIISYNRYVREINKKEKKMVDWRDERLIVVVDKNTGKKKAVVIDVKTGKVVR